MAVVRPAVAAAPLRVGVLVPGYRVETDRMGPRRTPNVYRWIDDTTREWDPTRFTGDVGLSLYGKLYTARIQVLRVYEELTQTADRDAFLRDIITFDLLAAKTLIYYEDQLREFTGDRQARLSLDGLPLTIELTDEEAELFQQILQELDPPRGAGVDTRPPQPGVPYGFRSYRPRATAAPPSSTRAEIAVYSPHSPQYSATVATAQSADYELLQAHNRLLQAEVARLKSRAAQDAATIRRMADDNAILQRQKMAAEVRSEGLRRELQSAGVVRGAPRLVARTGTPLLNAPTDTSESGDGGLMVVEDEEEEEISDTGLPLRQPDWEEEEDVDPLLRDRKRPRNEGKMPLK